MLEMVSVLAEGKCNSASIVRITAKRDFLLDLSFIE
jgi:hypothetical protein